MMKENIGYSIKPVKEDEGIVAMAARGDPNIVTLSNKVVMALMG